MTGAHLRAMRVAMNLSQSEMGDILAMSIDEVRAMEHGFQRMPKWAIATIRVMFNRKAKA